MLIFRTNSEVIPEKRRRTKRPSHQHKDAPVKGQLSRTDGLTRALMRSGELHVLMRGWPKGPPLRIFKSKSRRVKIQTASERSRRTLQNTIMLTLFFDL